MAYKIQEVKEMIRQLEREVRRVERVVTTTDVENVIAYVMNDAPMAVQEDLFEEAFAWTTLVGEHAAHETGLSYDVLLEAQQLGVLDTYQQLLEGMSVFHYADLEAQQTLEELKAQVTGEVDTRLQALNVQAQLDAFKGEELLLLRRALSHAAAAKAVHGAYRSAKEHLLLEVAQGAFTP